MKNNTQIVPDKNADKIYASFLSLLMLKLSFITPVSFDDAMISGFITLETINVKF